MYALNDHVNDQTKGCREPMGTLSNVLGFTDKEIIPRALAISGKRNPYFQDLLNEYKKRFPGAKILYANNTTGARLKNEPTADFVLIMQVMSVSNDRRLPDKPIIFVEAPLVFGERSIAGWTLAVEHGKIKEYFESVWELAPRLPQGRFYEYIESLLLSNDKESPLYWRKPENTDTFCRGIMKLSSMYLPKSTISKMRAAQIKSSAEQAKKNAAVK